VGDFERDTRVEGERGLYTATPSENWRIWGPMGGYAASIALRAAAAGGGTGTRRERLRSVARANRAARVTTPS